MVMLSYPSYHKISEEDLTFFKSIHPQILSVDTLDDYASDHTEDLKYLPELVLKPQNTEEVSKIMTYCCQKMIPVTPIGAQTGLSGGMLPVFGGVALSLEKMNAIVKLDEQNHQITAEPYVITQELQEFVASKNLFYPPDPASRGSCTIGGNVAENSGGPKALKYGVTSHYVLNLEVVLPNGEVIWTGANTLKNATGYNLTQLMVGSEGTLGVITKIVLKLIPLPKFNVLLMVPFLKMEQATDAVAEIFQKGFLPSALEFMEKEALDLTVAYTKSKVDSKEAQAQLLIEFDGNSMPDLEEKASHVFDLLQKYEIGEVLFANDQKQKEELWFLRRRVGEAVKAFSVYKEEDTVVPRYQLTKLLKGVKQIGAKYGFRSVCYGHAGDGNLHINILKENMSEQSWKNTVNKGVAEIFQLTKALGGTLSGEHGIGYVQKNFMPIVFSKTSLDLMMSIKKVFDPKLILNPGKIFPDSEE